MASPPQSYLAITGRLAPRWIEDLANRRIPEIDNIALGKSIASRFDDRIRQRNHVHDLIVIANQTTPEQVNPAVLSLVCRQCDHHFVIRVGWPEDEEEQLCNAGCPKYTFSGNSFPPPATAKLAHHIIHTERWSDEQIQQKKSPTYPLISGEEFCCSVDSCPLRISVEVSAPRLAIEWFRLLNDPGRLRTNLEEARRIDPDRFSDAKEETVASAFSVLQTYIRNRLADPVARKISKRNKRFQVVFGSELLPLFHALGYSEETSDNKGVPEDVLAPHPLEPAPQGSSPTPVESLRAFVDYMLTEITHHNPAEQSYGSLASGAERLERELHCSSYAKRQDTRLVPDSAEFADLGVLPQMHKTLIYYGFQAQCRTCPNDESALVQSLIEASTKLFDEELQHEAVRLGSMISTSNNRNIASVKPYLDPLPEHQSVELKAPPTDHALAWSAARYFGLNAPEFGTDNFLLGLYAEKKAVDATEARARLQVLAAFRGSTRLQEVVDGNMSIQTAMDILGLAENADCDDDFVEAYASQILNEHSKDKLLREQVIEAVLTIAQHRESLKLGAFHGQLENPGQPFTASRTLTISKPDMPAGLRNIGNTCYLNSCLQVLFSITPIRDLVTNPAGRFIELETCDINTRKIGYNKRGVSTEEAIIGGVFAKELGELFKSLETTSSAYLQPTQLLANSVLLNAEDVKRNAAKRVIETSQAPQVMDTQFPVPPPLPDRPSPGRVEHVEDARDVDMINVSVDAVSETASTGSSGTLVDQAMENTDSPSLKLPSSNDSAVNGSLGPVEEDVSMTDAPDPAEEDLNGKIAAILKALSTQDRTSGTAQQDVEEVMGSMLNHLQTILVPHATVDQIQWDLVTELCYYERRSYAKKEGETAFQEIGNRSLERSIVVYPAENGPCTLYEAMSRSLDLEILEDSRQQHFGAISRPPPVLFVQIQRTKSNNQKNDNAVTVDEVLYLDRFMDISHDSELMRLRQCAWHLQQQQNHLLANAPKITIVLDGPESNRTPHPPAELDDEAEVASESVLVNQPIPHLALTSHPFQFRLPTPPLAGADGPVARDLESLDVENLPTLKEIQAMSERQIRVVRDAIDNLFSHHQEAKYRLHAVVCHSGRLAAGHYWNWIHDSGRNKWFKYNDERVTEETDMAKFLETLNKAGEPYFLCYVREDVKDQSVSVPRRVSQPEAPLDARSDILEVSVEEMGDTVDMKSAATVEISIDELDDGFVPVARQNSPVNGVSQKLPPYDKNLSA